MPSSNGVYSLPVGYLAVTGTTIQASQHNPPLEDIASALTARLSRDGTAPMLGGLKAIAGTAALPGYVFATDASTGFLKTANGIGVSIAGTQVLEITAAGATSGVRFIGELIPYSGSSALPLTVIPVGQTLSRTTYGKLWTFAQTEIAAGRVFYNNGNGSTTFGIADMRGRVLAASDPTGLVLPTNGFLIGAGAGGSATHVLTAAEMPSHSHANTLNDPQHSHTITGGTVGGTSTANLGTGGLGAPIAPSAIAVASALTGLTITNANAGSGNAHSIVQPTLICNHLLFAGD
jgi:microcystin-dependent protein